MAIAPPAPAKGTKTLSSSTLKLVVPTSLRRGATRLKLSAAVTRAGAIEVTLLRGAKRIASGTVKVSRPGTVGIALKISTVTKRLKITIRKGP